jgi:acetyltransferase-like isoleucine patch superfamily enzyme
MSFLSRLGLKLSAVARRSPTRVQSLYTFFFQRCLGTRIRNHSHDNRLVLGFGFTTGLGITFFGNNNKVIIHSSVDIRDLEVHIVGSNITLVIQEGSQVTNGYFWLGGDSARMSIGSGSILIDNRINLTDSHSRIEIGSGCMLGSGSEIRLGDAHVLYDTDTGKILNQAHHVVLGSRVWLAQDSLILKNVEIGCDSVIGARSVVTRDIPPSSVAAGIPAKVIRSGVAWRVERIDDLPSNWFGDPILPR